MLQFLPKPLVGIIAITLYTLNLFIITIILLVIGFFKLILPFKKPRQVVESAISILATIWIYNNDFIMWLTIKTKWETQGLDEINKKGQYILICNHNSWSDILILFKLFNRKAPFIRFFLKRELIWVPILGVTCWVAGYPFMNRYNKAYLAKHPDRRGKDIENTKKACERFRYVPTTMTTFVEGTRFTKEKHQRQASPYQHLLKPKAGGAAFILSSMGEILDGMINATIIYPDDGVSMWDFICGRVEKIKLICEVLPIEESMIGDYQNDREFRTRFQGWLNKIWQEKDKLIEAEK